MQPPRLDFLRHVRTFEWPAEQAPWRREPPGLGRRFAGPGLVSARVECAILPKRFVDLLSLIFLEGRWQIISKVFHFEVEQEVVPGGSN